MGLKEMRLDGYEFGGEPSGFIKYRELLNLLKPTDYLMY